MTHLGSGVNCKLKLRFLPVVHAQPFHQERCKPGPGATTEGVEDQESLESSALVRQFPDPIKTEINDLLSDGVVSSSVVVGGILLSRDQLLRVEELSVGSSSDLINNGRFKIQEDGPGDVLSSSSLAEEGVEGVISTSNGLVRGHLTIGLDTVLQAVELPAGITDLGTGLAKMNRDALTLKEKLLIS